MENDDVTKYQVVCDTSVTDDYSVDLDLSKYTISVSGDDTFTWLDDSVKYDNTFSIMPESNHPAVYTSYEQREQHEKYPALKKAWDDYLNMYNLTQGEPPIVD
jgi:hypothetical protein